MFSDTRYYAANAPDGLAISRNKATNFQRSQRQEARFFGDDTDLTKTHKSRFEAPQAPR